jgi:hypothetical protein
VADFDTYGDLQATVADYLNRLDLTARIPSFIKLAHAKANRILRVRDMQTRAAATTTGDASGTYIPVPDDFLAPYSLEMIQGPGWGPPIAFISEDEAIRRRASASTQSAPPQFYTIFGSEFEVSPALTTPTDFRLKYYARIPALAGSTDSNWLLLKAPDFYLYGALSEAEPYLKNDERLAVWQGQLQKVIDDMTIESERALKPQSKLVAARRTFG